MPRKLNLHQPRLGVVRGAPDSRRPELALYDAENMLMRDAGEDKWRLTTRPGLEKLYAVDIGQDGAPISAVYPIEFGNSGEDYAQLDGDDIELEWAKASTSSAPSRCVVADLEGGSYFLSETGEITNRSIKGDVVFVAAIPIRQGHTVVPRLRIDPLGGIYCATSSNTPGGKSRIFKFTPRLDDEGADLAYVQDVTAEQIADFDQFGGQLYVGTNESIRASKIQVFEGVGDDSPLFSYEVATPYPLSRVGFGSGILFSCPPDDERGSGGPIQGDERIWSLADLDSADERVHAIYDARFAGSHPDGARIAQMPDARGTMGIAPHDTTERSLVHAYFFNPANEDGQPGPRFRVQVENGRPALSFDTTEGKPLKAGDVEYDNGGALWSRFLPGGQFDWKVDKLTVDGSLGLSRGLMPHVLTQRFLLAFKLRWPQGIGAGMVYSVGGYGGHGQFPADPSNCIALIVQDGGTVDSDGVIVSAEGKFSLRGALSSVVTGDAVLKDGAWEAIVLIQRNPGANSIVRVNGDEITNTLEIKLEDLVSPDEVWGNRIYRENRPRGQVLVPDPLNPGEFIFEQEAKNAADLWFEGADSYFGLIQFGAAVFAPSGGAGVHKEVFPVLEMEQLEGSLAWGALESGELIVDAGHSFSASPPLSGSGTVINEGDTARALRSPDGIIGRVAAGDAGVQWAIAGSGIGWDFVANKAGDIYTLGPRLADGSLPDDAGPRSRVLRRIRDRGFRVDSYEPSAGNIIIIGQPDALDKFTVNAGDGLPVVFEFDGVGTPGPMYVPIARGGDAAGTAVATLQQMTASPDSKFYAVRMVQLGPETYQIDFLSRLDPTGTADPIVLNSGAGHLGSTLGMTGGAAPEGTWDVRANENDAPFVPDVFMDALPDGDLFTPFPTFTDRNLVRRYAKADGALVWETSVGTSSETAYSVAVDRRVIGFGPDVDSPEFLWAALDADQGDVQLRLVSRTKNDRPPSERATLVVKGGNSYAIYDDGTVQDMTDGQPFEFFDPYLQTVEFQGLLLVSDGQVHRVWNPAQRTFEEWKANRGSGVPAAFRLMAVCYSRVVHAGGPDPYRWIMSAAEDFEDYDLNPQVPTADQAVSSDTGEGQTSTNDSITALIPMKDDLCLFGGTRTVSRQTGDPMAGGAMDSVTRDAGIAFGRAWCHTQNGSAAFFGVPNSVWRVDGAGLNVENVSRGLIEHDLRQIDLSKFQIRMEYSEKLGGFMVIPIPLSLDQETDLRWWFCDNSGAWWPMRWMDRKHQPLSVAKSIGSGEPIFGCYDGVVRTLTGLNGTDDGQEFLSFAIYGPIHDRQYRKRWRFTKPFLRFTGDGPVEWFAYASETVSDPGMPNQLGEFRPGEPTPGGMKLRSNFLFLEFRAFGVRWSQEHAQVSVHSAGDMT